jgi:hypothetical protein
MQHGDVQLYGTPARSFRRSSMPRLVLILALTVGLGAHLLLAASGQ